MKIGDRVKTPYGSGVIRVEETNRVEYRYGVEMDNLNKVPFEVDLSEGMDYSANPDILVYFFKSELSKEVITTKQ